ncbi:MAG: DUF2802 domain-containing protein [Succinivibrio sp.]|nr:DUF2802 domain-containing protein [Succinivibrio sp.]
MENTLLELKKAFADLKAQQSRIEEAVIAIERKGQAQDRTVSYLTDTRQSLDDKIAEVEKVLDNLSSKLEQQNKVIAENNTQTQPINEAARMLRRGASMEEVIAKTGLPRNEIEMLSSVHGFNKPENSENPSESVHIVKPDQVSPEVQVNARSDLPRPAGIQSGHVAGLKARNAYGIPAGHHSLRRTR